jgi:hypothetical protein
MNDAGRGGGEASGDGGGIYSTSPVAISNCAIIGNRAGDSTPVSSQAGRGGGIYLKNGDSSVANCLIYQNSAGDGPRDGGDGGGVYADNGQITLANCTIARNSAGHGENGRDGIGGGVFFAAGAGIVDNSILWGDVLWNGTLDEIAGEPTVSYSIIQGGWPGQGNLAADPLFVDLVNGDLHLLPGSPAIDAADNLAVLATIYGDLDGNFRFVDDPKTPDTGNGTPPIVDMGAYECQAGGCDPCDMNCDGSIDAFDIEAFLDLLFGGGRPCDECTGDVNADGVIDAFDIEPFLECLFP